MNDATMADDARRRFRGARRAACALACCVLFTLAAADGARARQGGRQEETVTDSLLTEVGTLSVVRFGEENKLQMELRLDGKKLIDLSGNMYARFVAQFRRWDAGELVVLALGSGGSGCPEQFQIVYVAGTGLASLTEEFGDCGDLPTITLQQVPEEQLTLRFPGYYRLAQTNEPGFRKPPPTTWVYSKGRLRKQQTPARRRGR